MYGITLGSFACPFFFEDKGERITTFTLGQMRLIIDGLLDRKLRNNGHGRHLLDVLRRTGSCRHDYRAGLGFSCLKRSDGTYCITLLGDYPSEVVERLNRPSKTTSAIALTRSIRSRRRELRALGLYKDAPKSRFPRALAGANGDLRHHFKNTTISCADAITAIAYATKLQSGKVTRRLVRSLDEQAVAIFRLKGGFVFRLDLINGYRGLLSIHEPVELRSTNDNRHGAYRRLRAALRRLRQSTVYPVPHERMRRYG